MQKDSPVQYTGEYIHARRFGTCKETEALRFWSSVADLCEKHNCYNILCESFLTGASTFEGFRYVELFPAAYMSYSHRLAYVCHRQEATDDMRFIMNVLRNRGLVNGRLFSDLEAAIAWLKET